MVNYTNVLSIGGAIIIEIAFGFISCKFGFFKPAAINSLNRFALKCCFLPMIARQIAVRDLKTLSFMPLAILVLTVITISILLGLICYISKCFKNRFHIFLSTFLPLNHLNYLIIGLPMFRSIWGEEESIVAAVSNMCNDFSAIPLYFGITRVYKVNENNKMHEEANDGQHEKVDWHLFVDILIRVFTNNFMIGNILGFVYAATGWKMCPYLWNLMKYLADSVLALCMFAVGGFLSEHSIIACNFVHLLVTLFARHVLFPIIAAVFCFLFRINHRLARQITIMATTPSSSASFLLSSLNQTGPGVASSMILWSTVLYIPFIILWLFVLDSLHIFE